MPIKTDLSVSPYFDDFNEDKQFHKILFKPEVAVQTRELEQVQSILQNQIERFGNNIFKRGTIIDGINFIFYDNYPYVKINDIQIDNLTAIPENYLNLFVKNSRGLTAYVIDYQDGFESTNPDLKTLYLKYTNSGDSYTDTSFSPGEVLTVTDANNSIFKINVTAAGTGYSNSDVIVITPVLLANVTSGSIGVGDTITDTITGAAGVVTAVADETTRIALVNLAGTVAVASAANVTGTGTTFLSDFSNGDYISVYSNSSVYTTRKINIVSNNTFMNLASNISFTNTAATYANTSDSRSYISYSPISAALTNASSTSNTWSFSVGSTLRGNTSNDLGDVVSITGINAAASVLTDSAGRILLLNMTNMGNGYSRIPNVSVKSTSGSGANVAAQNFYGQVSVSALAGSIGSGYAFGITEGIVYQKGYFIKVDAQTVIVDKYSRIPDAVTVGFVTSEELINANIDTSLFDNSGGFPNQNAPGADRLKLVPTLTAETIDNAALDPDFFNLVEWAEGYPYKQNNRTFYNVINDQAATSIKETSGNFVVDRFLVTTTSPSNSALVANSMAVVVDPGTAYVDGYKVQTYYNYSVDSPKAIDTKIQTNTRVSLNYGNYVRINNVGGFFEFDRANIVDLYDTPKGFLANNSLIAAGNMAPAGTKIGEARARNFVFEQGTPGSPNATYRLYLFQINMYAGKSFKDVQSVYANSTSNKGIADLILEPNLTTSNSANAAVLYGNNNTLVFDTGFAAPLGANNIDYIYRTIDDGLSMANTGILTISLSGSPTKAFPYTGTLSDAQKSELYIAPLANLYASAALTGTVNTTASNSTVTGVGTDFTGQLKAGIYLNLNGGVSNNAIKRITSITNSTSMTVDSNLTFTATGVTIRKAWPGLVPIELPYNTSFTANTSVSRDTLNINIGSTLNVATNTAFVVAYNVENQNPTPTTKTPNRNSMVKLQISNNAGGHYGPWSLGVPDIFRLRNVYRGNSSVSTTSSDITSEFYIDHNQNGNIYNLGTLNIRTSSQISLSDDDYLLVVFDCFTASPGFYTISSYVSSNKGTRFVEDSKALSDLSTTINTFEIPEVSASTGAYLDLISKVDFRPYVDATANITSNVSLVTTNPANTISFAASDRFFPLPDSVYKQDVEYFLPRIDTIILDKSSNIRILNGTPGASNPVMLPAGAMRLNDLAIPAYPSLPQTISNNMMDIISTNVYSGGYNGTRLLNKIVTSLFTDEDYALQQPMNYTEEEIGQLDRRITALEYYQALTMVQASVTNMIIPSSLSPNIDRFKYGFFVDDYIDASFSDTFSPEYSATIMDGYALPLMVAFNTVHSGLGNNASAYTTTKLLSQDTATNLPVPPPPPPPPSTYSGTLTIDPTTFKSQSYTITTTTTTSTPAPSYSGGKIVCTAMNEEYGFGSFRNAIWLEHSRGMDPAYEKGYHKLVLPLIERVYKSDKKNTWSSKLIRSIGERMARKRTADLWKMKRGKMDLEGRFYRTILEPICFVVGWAVINISKDK